MARQIRHHIKELEPQQRLQVEFEAIKSTPPNMPASPPSPKSVLARRISKYFRVPNKNVLDGGVIYNLV